MRVKECKVRYHGRDCWWITPAIILSGSKYAESVQGPYRRFFQIEVVWFFWSWTLWLEYSKVKEDKDHGKV